MEEACNAEEAQKQAEAKQKKQMEEVQVQHVRNQQQQYAWEQHEKTQKQAQAITTKQGVRETSVVACVPCQMACKLCSWMAEASMLGGSGTEASGKAVQKWAVKRRPRTAMNALPRGGEKQKKACTTTEEGEDDEDNTEEVFRVPKAMAEEQHDALGMLTQMLAQMEERMAAAEVREVARAERWERHMVVVEAAVLEHLALEQRRSVWEDERSEMERACMEIKQQCTDDMWQLGTFV